MLRAGNDKALRREKGMLACVGWALGTAVEAGVIFRSLKGQSLCRLHFRQGIREGVCGDRTPWACIYPGTCLLLYSNSLLLLIHMKGLRGLAWSYCTYVACSNQCQTLQCNISSYNTAYNLHRVDVSYGHCYVVTLCLGEKGVGRLTIGLGRAFNGLSSSFTNISASKTAKHSMTSSPVLREFRSPMVYILNKMPRLFPVLLLHVVHAMPSLENKEIPAPLSCSLSSYSGLRMWQIDK